MGYKLYQINSSPVSHLIIWCSALHSGEGAISCDSCKNQTDQKSIPTRLFDRRVDEDEDVLPLPSFATDDNETYDFC